MKSGTRYFISFKELDEIWAAPKGAAFRAFKRCLPQLIETRDFVRLDAMQDQAKIERLRAAGRIYAGSVHVVLLSESGLRKLTPP